MKKYYYAYGLIALTLVIALPAMTQAEDGGASVEMGADVNVQAHLPPPPNLPANMPESMRQRILNDYAAHIEDMKNNQGTRNMLLERRGGTSTPEGDDNATGTRPMMGRLNRFASSTMPGHGEDGRGMAMRMLEMRKHMIARQFEVAISNLNNVSDRLGSRIGKEQQAGRDMTDALGLLAIAKDKIAIASSSVAALEAFMPTASTTVSASTTINFDGARALADKAREDIKTAQKALNDVVVSVAHSMGFKFGDDEHATTTASTTSH